MISKPEFRFYYFTKRYDETVFFYKNILQLKVFRSWNRPNEKGTIFTSPNGMGLIEIEAGEKDPVFNGMGIYIQVDDPDSLYTSLAKTPVTVIQPIITTSYGHRSFKIEDPNKLLISFFAYIDPAV